MRQARKPGAQGSSGARRSSPTLGRNGQALTLPTQLWDVGALRRG